MGNSPRGNRLRRRTDSGIDLIQLLAQGGNIGADRSGLSILGSRPVDSCFQTETTGRQLGVYVATMRKQLCIQTRSGKVEPLVVRKRASPREFGCFKSPLCK